MGTDLSAQVAEGDRRQSLVAIRDRLAAELTTAEGSAVATLAKELRAVLAEIDNLPAVGVSKVDQLAARRKARVAGGASRSRSRQQRGS